MIELPMWSKLNLKSWDLGRFPPRLAGALAPGRAVSASRQHSSKARCPCSDPIGMYSAVQINMAKGCKNYNRL